MGKQVKKLEELNTVHRIDVFVLTEVNNVNIYKNEKNCHINKLKEKLTAMGYTSYHWPPWQKTKNGAVLIAVKPNQNLNSKVIVESEKTQKKVIVENKKIKEKIRRSNLELLDDEMIEVDKDFDLDKCPVRKYETHDNSTWTRQVLIKIKIKLDGLDEIYIYGVYAPAGLGKRKVFWDCCITPVQKKLKNRKSIIIGDFNEYETGDVYKEFGKPSKLRAEHDQQRSKLDQLKKDGWVDAWEEKHKNYKAAHDMDRFTYYHNKIIDSNPIPTMQSYGRRLDYAFLSKSLSKHLVAAEHLHDVRQDGLSDHSALLIELDLGEKNNQAAQQP